MRIFRNAVMHCSTNVHLTVGAKECALLKPPMFAADLIFFVCVCIGLLLCGSKSDSYLNI